MCNMIVDGIAYTFGVFLGEFVQHFGEGKGKVAWVGSCLSGVYLSAGIKFNFNKNNFPKLSISWLKKTYIYALSSYRSYCISACE